MKWKLIVIFIYFYDYLFGMVKDNFDNANNFVFTALRGIQAGREYYTVMCPLRLIPRMFLYNELEIPPQLRAQRTLNKARIPEIANYMLNNENEYIFSSITASIDGDIEFVPVEKEGHFSRLGTLIVPMTARFLINDGQHRRAAIEQALSKKSELGMEYISVVFFLDKGLKKSQQMFSDLNKNAVKPSTSLNILYNHRNSFSKFIVEMLNEIPIFSSNLTELEKTSISNRSHKVFTLNSVYNATKDLLGKTQKKPKITKEEKQLVIEYWKELYSIIKEWQDVVNKEKQPYELRDEFVHVYGILLQSFGLIGKELIEKYPKTWKSKLKKLEKIDWKRTNKEWQGRAIITGRLTKMKQNIILTTNLLKKYLDLPLNEKEKKLELKLN